MNRKEFLLRTGQTCACFGALLTLGGTKAGAVEENESPCKEQDGKLAFVHAWVADLTEALDTFADDKTKAQILERCGRGCAERNSAGMIEKYKGDPAGLVAQIESTWAEAATYDQQSGIATVKGREQKECPCPLAKQPPLASASFCLCSQGWFKQAFESAYGAPVTVELTESVLGGAPRCSFRIERA